MSKSNNKLNIPMSLERVVSSGKFLTDGIFMKVVGCCFLSVIISLVITMQLQRIIPSNISWILFYLETLIQLMFYIPKLALSERKLAPVLDNLINNEICNTNKFYDIYEFMGSVAVHQSGHLSMFVEITRGTTLGATEQEKGSYYDTLKKFENRILFYNYTLKTINIESLNLDKERSLMLNQTYNSSKYSSNLQNNLKLKYDYTEEYMRQGMNKERLIYIIVSRDADIEVFEKRVQQLVRNIRNPLILTTHVYDSLTDTENLAIEYFNTKSFDSELYSKNELRKSILKFEGETL